MFSYSRMCSRTRECVRSLECSLTRECVLVLESVGASNRCGALRTSMRSTRTLGDTLQPLGHAQLLVLLALARLLCAVCHHGCQCPGAALLQPGAAEAWLDASGLSVVCELLHMHLHHSARAAPGILLTRADQGPATHILYAFTLYTHSCMNECEGALCEHAVAPQMSLQCRHGGITSSSKCLIRITFCLAPARKGAQGSVLTQLTRQTQTLECTRCAS